MRQKFEVFWWGQNFFDDFFCGWAILAMLAKGKVWIAYRVPRFVGELTIGNLKAGQTYILMMAKGVTKEKDDM